MIRREEFILIPDRFTVANILPQDVQLGLNYYINASEMPSNWVQRFGPLLHECAQSCVFQGVGTEHLVAEHLQYPEGTQPRWGARLTDAQHNAIYKLGFNYVGQLMRNHGPVITDALVRTSTRSIPLPDALAVVAIVHSTCASSSRIYEMWPKLNENSHLAMMTSSIGSAADTLTAHRYFGSRVSMRHEYETPRYLSCYFRTLDPQYDNGFAYRIEHSKTRDRRRLKLSGVFNEYPELVKLLYSTEPPTYGVEIEQSTDRHVIA